MMPQIRLRMSGPGWLGPFILFALVILVLPAAASHRGVTLVDFESGSAPLQSYEDEDFDPDAWEIQAENTYNGSAYALRIWGNTWKQLDIDSYPLLESSVIEVAIYAEERGEIQAIAFGDSTENVLFYAFEGEQLVLSDRWNVSYQSAFPREEWHAFRLAVGQDWLDTWGYVPELARIVFVNDRDDSQHGITIFDEVRDVTADLPIAPEVEIQALVDSIEELAETTSAGERLYRLDVQFQAIVFDPDSEEHTYRWDFGDGATSAEEDPLHSFLAVADYTFTVALDVADSTGLFGRDTCQVSVEPGPAGGVHSINFVGDIFTGRRYEEPGGLIDTYGVEYLFEPTREILGEAADVTVVNAEVPFTDRGEPHPTKSVVFRTWPENIAGLVYAGFDVATLGNNHIVDYGLEGLEQTLEVFDEAGIIHGGAGVNAYFAEQPCYYTHEGVRFGFVFAANRTGREYNARPFLEAGYEKCGHAYWLHPVIERSIAQADSFADIVISYSHSGFEYEPMPEPESGGSGLETDFVDPELCPPYVPFDQAKDVTFRIWPGMTDRQLRWHAADCGADAVINAHPHVLQGFEVYNGVLIAHSLGNFLFDLYYPETMPTMVLRATFDKEGIRRWTFKPAFIDHYIPVPCHGRLAREILDRMADYSRQLGAIVGVNAEVETGVIYIDPTSAIYEVTHSSGTQPLIEREDEWVSQPIELASEGNLSKILDVTGVTLQDCEICWGREVLWFGRYEPDEEGHHMWNFNSGDEWLDDEYFVEGSHSCGLHRAHNVGGNVVNMLEKHLVANDTLRYSLNGWMMTENANNAYFSVRFYDSRYTWNQISEHEMGPSVDGDSDWTWYTNDFEAPDGAVYFNIRTNLDTPAQGDAYAYFDDLRVIEWLPWEPLTLPLEVPYPNNYRFLQVRVPTSADSVTVFYEETALRDEPGYAAVDPRQPRPKTAVLMKEIYPNPVRDLAKLRYRLSQRAQVSLAIYDVGGRLIERLADRDWQRPGWHTVYWNGAPARSGVYFSQLTVDGETYSRKMVLLP